MKYPPTSARILIAVLATQLGCFAPGRAASGSQTAGPPTGSEAAEVFQSLRDARLEQGKRPPSWVGLLEPLARQGAEKIATGGDFNTVGHDIGEQAAYRFGRNVLVWTFHSDILAIKPWPPRLLAAYSLGVAVGVALMQTTAPGRYAVVVVIPEAGM